MAYEFRQTRRVEFAETDVAGIAHFSNFFRYMEAAEHAFLRSLGLSVHAEIEGRLICWPRIHARCSYLAPLRFEEEFEVRLLVRSKRQKSIAYEFWFSDTRGRTVARGKLVTVCTTPDPATGRLAAIAIPRQIDDKIEAAPRDVIRSLRARARTAVARAGKGNSPVEASLTNGTPP